MKPSTVLIDRHPGRNSQSIGLARAIGTDPDLIHEPSVGVVGTKGDSQCYLGVMAKVEASHNKLKGRVGAGQDQQILGQPAEALGLLAGGGDRRAEILDRPARSRGKLELDLQIVKPRTETSATE